MMITVNIVSQALYMIPRSTTPFCGLPAVVSGRPWSLRLPVRIISENFKGHRSVLLRAEENSDAVVLETEEEVEVEIEAQKVVDVEERAPRKPRVKLGDIMGNFM